MKLIFCLIVHTVSIDNLINVQLFIVFISQIYNDADMQLTIMNSKNIQHEPAKDMYKKHMGE